MPVIAQKTTQRIILTDIQWCTYTQLLQERHDDHTVLMTYDQGTLELMAPSFAHEHINRILAMLVDAIALARGTDLYPAGSTTFTRADLARGFEPDSCYYTLHAAAVRGKASLDLTRDPPPDLVIEVDITQTSLDKLPLYAAIGVPELWRYVDNTFTILRLHDGGYVASEASTLWPGLPTTQLSTWLQQYDQLAYPTWMAMVRRALQ